MTKPSVVFLEDDPTLKMLYTIMLEGAGYEVRHFEDRQSAYNEIRANPPTVVLTDNKVFPSPGVVEQRGEGLELIKQLKLSHPNMPIVMITSDGNIEEQAADKGVPIHVNGHPPTGLTSVPVIAKPLNFQDVADAMQKEIQRYALWQTPPSPPPVVSGSHQSQNVTPPPSQSQTP